MSRANFSTGFFSGNKPQEPVSVNINDTQGTELHEDTEITRPNGSVTLLKNLAVGDRIRTLAPRSEWLGKMLNADGSYNNQAVKAVWTAGSLTIPNPNRFDPLFGLSDPNRLPVGTEFVLGEAEIAYITVSATINKIPAQPSLFWTSTFVRESGGPAKWISGGMLYTNLITLGKDPLNPVQYVFMPYQGLMRDGTSLRTKKPFIFSRRFLMPNSGGIPTPTNGTTAWNVSNNRGIETGSSANDEPYTNWPYPRIGRYFYFILKKVDANSCPIFLANGIMAY